MTRIPNPRCNVAGTPQASRYRLLSSPRSPVLATMAVLLCAFSSIRSAALDSTGTNAGGPVEPSSQTADARQISAGLAEALRQLSAKAIEGRAARANGLGGLQPIIQPMAAAANEEAQVHLRQRNGTVRQIRGRNLEGSAPAVAKAAGKSRAQRAMGFLQANRTLLRLSDPSAELAVASSQMDELGHSHVRFGQVYRGLPVWPAGLAVHFDRQGSVSLIDGAYVPTPELPSLEPALDAETAVAQAKALVSNTPGGFHSQPELIIYAPLDGPPRLGWKFELTVSLAEAWLFVVDAKDGQILHRGERVLDANVSGSGVDLAGTTRTLNVWQGDGFYYLADTSKQSYNPNFNPLQDPHGVITIADGQGLSINDVLTTAVPTVSSRNFATWEVPAAVSAAFHFSETYDYFLDRHGRDSLDGQGGNITAIVRVGEYNNASWHGNLRVMLFGDVLPFAGSLDVVGHELSHGVTETSAGLIYQNQSGAMNEAFSDIFGEMVEARTLGQSDWKMGTGLGLVVRDMSDPNAVFSPLISRPLPARMSQFADLPNTRESDHGGVHINSSIINHAFYLLAEGLEGAIGLRDAERVFFRALTHHLQPQSEFIDCRLACVASAEEIFGTGSTQARKTAEAFDAVEIFAAPNTPEPSPLPVVSGPDSTLFIYPDVFSGVLALGRREAAQGDDDFGADLAWGVHLARPAVTGDGSIALFVSPVFDVCGIATDDPNSRQCLGYDGMVHSVAISPDGTLAAFVLRNPLTGEPDGKINVLNLADDSVKTFNLLAPSADGIAVDAVLYADSMTFSTDGQFLIYDAISQLKFGNGPTVQRWSIYSLNVVTEQTAVLVPPLPGIDTGNPALGRAGNRFLAFEALEPGSGTSTVVVLDLFTGESGEIATVEDAYAFPSFLGDESAIVYAAPDLDALGGYSLIRQDLTPNRLAPSGQPVYWLQDAYLGVIYRRGEFQGTNAAPTATLEASATPSVPATVTLTATAADPDGSVSKVEFYNGSVKIGEAVSLPYSFVWNNVPAGQYRLVARAIDNLGAAGDSASVNLAIGAPPTNNLPALKLSALPGNAVRITVTGPPGDYIISQTHDLRSWSDIYPVTVGSGGTASIDDSGGPANFPQMFYKVRRD